MNIRYALAGVVAAGAIVLPAASAHADDTCPIGVPAASCHAPGIAPVSITTGGGFGPSVEGSTAVQVAPATAVQTAPASSTLPFTGGDVAGLAAAGLGLLGAGVVLVRRNRVRPGEARA